MTDNAGTFCSSASVAGNAPKLFWWQWPCTCAAAARGAKRSRLFSARNSASSMARSASARASGPGSSDGSSSFSVNRHDGSSPTTGASPASAASVRRISRRARSTMPAARKVRPQHSGRPRMRGTLGRTAGRAQHAHRGAQILRLEIAVEGIGEQQHRRAVRRRRGHRPRDRRTHRRGTAAACARGRDGAAARPAPAGWRGPARSRRGARGAAARRSAVRAAPRPAPRRAPPSPRSSSAPCPRRSGTRAGTPCRRRRGSAPP